LTCNQLGDSFVLLKLLSAFTIHSTHFLADNYGHMAVILLHLRAGLTMPNTFSP